MRKNITIAICLFSAAITCMAGSGGNSPVIEWKDSTTLAVRFDVRADDVRLGTNDRLVVMPRLVGADGNSRWLPFVEYAGKQNRKYFDRRAALQGEDRNEVKPVDGSLTYEYTVRAESWMRHTDLTLAIERDYEDCCCVTNLPGDTAAAPRYYWPGTSKVVPRISVAERLARTEHLLKPVADYRPVTTATPLRRIPGAQFVFFPISSTELKADFRRNRETLDRVVNILKTIEPDTASAVVYVNIVGSASPDGPAKQNNRLAEGRAKALCDYIRACGVGLPDSAYRIATVGEAWADLRDAALSDSVPAGDELIRIIDGTDDPDRRELLMKRLNKGKTYDYLRRHVLAEQRHSGYVNIYYSARPDEPALAINRAVELIAEGRYAEALAEVEKWNDPRKWNTQGTALYRLGRKDDALRCFRLGAETGDEEAARNYDMLNN